MKGKKLLTSAIALGTAAALVLGGTFAWQSINQTALNEASDIVNPGGRLHDDFNGTNKDIYVENFTDTKTGDDIFARVRLEEFFEIVLNKGTAGEKTVPMIGTKTAVLDDEGEQKKTEDGNPVWEYTYVPVKDYTDHGSVDGVQWWNWITGGSKYYMPTFNKNKDSLKADISGAYKFDTGVITDKDIAGGQYTTMDEWESGDEKTAYSIYDIDSNTTDEIKQAELAEIIASGDITGFEKYVKTIQETHEVKETLEGTLMSMEEWLELDEDEQVGGYWVYDTDGWVYWASPIKPGTSTGLLLDGIELAQVMDDSWYYAINVVAQFVTANDVGKSDNTGFYADGETVSENAEKLLETIGVTIPVKEEDKGLVLTGEFVREESKSYILCDLKLDGKAVTDRTYLTVKIYSDSGASMGFVGCAGDLVTFEEGKLKIDFTFTTESVIDPCDMDYFYIDVEYGGDVQQTSNKIRLDCSADTDGGDDNTTHTLTAKPLVEDAMPVEMYSGRLPFTVNLDGTDLESADNLSAKLYKAGETETPLAEFASSDISAFYADEDPEVLQVNLLKKGVKFTAGENKYDLYLSYQTADGVVNAEKISATFTYSPLVLKTVDEENTIVVRDGDCAYMELDGNSTPLDEYSTSNSFIVNVTAKAKGFLNDGDELNTVTFELKPDNDWVVNGMFDEVYYGLCEGNEYSRCTVMFDYENNLILFWNESDQVELTVTINGTQWKANIVDTLE